MKSEEAKSTIQSGHVRIARAFQKALATKRAALMPYFTLGYPDLAQSLEIIRAVAQHSDLLELGVPFSDPIADGPTIQRSTQTALDQGVNTAACLEGVRVLRSTNLETPILLMGYYNPILAYGEAQYIHDAAAAGVDGFIIPDLPLEEAAEFAAAAEEHGLVVVYFLAPTSNRARIRQVAQKAQGFVYMVSVTGVTGARNDLSKDLARLVGLIREESDVPVAVGFGISTPEQAGEVGQYADGVIVGSALINAVDQSDDKPWAAVEFIRLLESALQLE